MLYITIAELTLLAPEAVKLAAVRGKEINYINRASTVLDGYLNRGRYGMEVRAIMNVQIPLSLSFSGVLPTSPFVEWIGTDGELRYTKNNELFRPLKLEWIHVQKRAGVISTAPSRWNHNFPQEPAIVRSPWLDTALQYHGSILTHVEPHEHPMTLLASYRAGMYFARPIVASVSGTVGLDEIELTKVDYIQVGDEFYFDSDISGDPYVDRRFVTTIDTEAKRIGFEPELSYPLPPEAKFRRVDRCVRVATAALIGVLATYPPDTKVFDEGLGRNALVNTWERSDGGDVMRNISHLMRF